MAETEKDLDQEVADSAAGEEAAQAEANEDSADGEQKTQEAVDQETGTGKEAAFEETEDAAPGEAALDGDEAGTAARDSTEAESSDTAENSAKEKKSFFSKKDKNKEKDKDKERIAELEDRVMRQMAEFDNFRRRTEKEKQQMFETGARSVIEKILPVVDNFERGISSIPEAERQGAVAEGMNMIYKQLLTELDNIGVKAIEAVGKEFDPAKHNAVMQVSSEEYESGIVAQELQKGYTYRDTVIRHSMVAVVE